MEATAPDSQALPPGTHLHEFVIERVLGSGGFGITYLARDTGLNRQVVIKENLPSQFVWRETATGTVRPRHSTGGDTDDFEWSMRNFLREAETLATMDHPGIVRVLRKFEANGTAYFVMPFVQGIAFDQLIAVRQQKNQPFTEEELRGLLERMLDALAYLHDRGIYHRDIKPGNLLITMEGIPTLIDFGSARQRLSERSMTVVESAGYTPFEQLQSRGNVGPWSDLYALAATLCKAITGEAPPKANDRAFDDPFISLVDRNELLDRYSLEFLTTIDTALASRVPDRWQKAEEWLAVLRKPTAPSSAFGGLPTATVPRYESAAAPVPASSQLVATHKRKGKALQWVIAACVVLGLIAVSTFIASYNNRSGSVIVTKPAEEPEPKAQGVEQQHESVAKAGLLELAKNGDAYAQALVGFDLLYGRVELLSDYERAKRKTECLMWLEKSCAQEHPLGLALRGSAEIYFMQAAGETYAVKRYEEAVKAGLLVDLDTRGAVWVCFAANAYRLGRGVEKNQIEAVKWHRIAANQGIGLAQDFLGTYYLYGDGVIKNEAEAVKWFRKAEQAGFVGGMHSLGFCYANGTGVAKNEAEAAKWYRKAADAGYVPAMNNIGVCYLYGIGVANDEAEAAKWYLKAAEAGYVQGMVNLGLCYDNGTGLAKDESEAVKWYRKAAEARDTDGMNFLGVCYEYGTGVTQDEAEAARWYRRAAEAGNPNGMNNLGLCYANGTGVAKDEEEAVKWYRKAAEAGNTRGMVNLAISYSDGTGVAKNEAEAAKWYLKAAEAGHADGMNNLGSCYKYGVGVAKDEVRAAKWYRKAAEAGNARGMFNLGLCYQYGTGLAEDEAEAAKWYRKAAQVGDKEVAQKAADNLKELGR